MALIGISLLVASVVYVVIRPPTWLPRRLSTWFSRLIAGSADRSASSSRDSNIPTIAEPSAQDDGGVPAVAPSTPPAKRNQQAATPTVPDIELRPPPPPRTSSIQPPAPTIEEPESPTTPKALKAPSSAMPPPSFTISSDKPAASMLPPPRPQLQTPASASSSMMPPPPPKLPTLAQFPAANSAQRARGPAPNRGPSGGLAPAGLAPPPTHSSKPNKPSRQVTLDPGHSPLDWARISGPNADLRGLDPSSAYLRVTPSMLKIMTGRKGKDAWMALNGKVYNVTPYAAFHPGGIPELMRGAGRDGTQLFGEVHPWVNYETMLTACLVGLLVDEPTDANVLSEIDQMD